MALSVNPSDFQFEVQGTKYFMRFEMDIDIGEAFIAAQFDNASNKWDGFIFGGGGQVAINYYGGGTMEGLVKYYVGEVNKQLEKNHGTPADLDDTATLIEQENFYLKNNVTLVNERLIVT